MKPLALDVSEILKPLTPGVDLLPGVTYLGPRFEEVILLGFESPSARFDVRVEPVSRPGEGYLSTGALRLSYQGPLPLDKLAHLTVRTLGGLIRKTEKSFRRVEYSEMAARLRGPEDVLTHGKTAEIRLIIRCNETCAFCHTDERAENVVFSLERFKKHLPELKSKGIHTLILTGGEPTLRADLADFVSAASGEGFRDIILQTNATRLHQNDLARQLKAAGLGSLFVSLHSQHAEVLAKMTGFMGALEHTTAGIAAAMEAGLPVTLNHVLTVDNLEGLEGFVPFVVERFGAGVQEIVFSMASPNFHGGEESTLLIDPAGLGPRLSAALREALNAGYAANIPSLCGVPSCVLDMDVRHLHRDLAEEFPKFHGREDRVFVSACGECAVRSRCTGIWRTVVRRFGEAWVRPVD